MSRKERITEDILTMKASKLVEQRYRCGCCRKPIGAGAQLAHRIPQRKWCISRWGLEVVHHRDNMVLVCGLECNAAVQIDPNSKEAEELAAAIRHKILEEAR